MWHSIATERFGAKNPASARLRFFSGNSGATLTARQPFNNVVRSTIQCLGAVLGGAQSIHVMGYDEAYELPSEEAVTLSLRTQQIIALESGVARTADPLAGSYYVEWLTDEVERRAWRVLADVETAGGAVVALEAGVPQSWIADSAYRIEQDLSSGSRPKVGVNVFASADAPPDFTLFHLDEGIAERQIARLGAHLATRDAAAAAAALDRLANDVDRGSNVMPALIDASRAGATLGEMSDVLRESFGEFREPNSL
jgi:methylmalonyl-CoA mutase N-terminal domain/subunit